MQQKFDPQAVGTEASVAKTFTGNRGLEIEEGLIFEIGRRKIPASISTSPCHSNIGSAQLSGKNRPTFRA
jgi:hypothetical protein